MNTQHTPAEWTYSSQKGTPGHCLVAQVWAPNGKSIADITPTLNPAEATANARLIAAAPEMYDLLEYLLADYEQDWAGDEPRPLTDFELRLQDVVNRINPRRPCLFIGINTPDLSTEYYIVSLCHTQPRDKFITLWCPNNAGYCFSKQRAGVYPTPIDGYHESEINMAITSSQADEIFVKAEWDGDTWDMIPNSQATWDTLGVKMHRKRKCLVRKELVKAISV